VYRDSLLLSTLLQPFSARGGAIPPPNWSEDNRSPRDIPVSAWLWFSSHRQCARKKLHVSARKFAGRREWAR